MTDPEKSGTFPITDNHFHIDLKRGRGLDAVNDFRRAGGTHVFLVSLPSWTLGYPVRKPEDFIPVFEETIRTAETICRETDVTAFPVLGIHPVEIMHLSEEYGIARASEIMTGGFDIAASYVLEKKAVGIKSGRPHFPVSPEILEASGRVMSHAFETARDIGCPVQLHVEDMTPESVENIAKIAKDAGIDPGKVMNHHAAPLVSVCEKHGIWPSVTTGKDMTVQALSQGARFLMETDYCDDPSNPGFVLGPKTVPKRTKQLLPEWGEEVFRKIHQENPAKIYDVEIEL